jgi:hypothetical protein
MIVMCCGRIVLQYPNGGAYHKNLIHARVRVVGALLDEHTSRAYWMNRN